jgi:protein TonB
VEVEFTVDALGAVTDVAVVASEPHGVFDSAASEAVAAWRYRPRVVNGRPVAQRTSVTLSFNVED